MRVDFASEISTGERFEFGANWTSFLDHLDETRLAEAISAIQQALGVQTLNNCSVLDIGSGSGLSSLAFHRLGARVTSFDIDPACVACTERLKDRYGSVEREWRVMRGSVLDPEFIRSLGQFDVVYSWGVLHHTGEMWRAMQIATDAVRSNGKLCIAIYNDQGPWSRCWLAVKKAYNRLPVGFKWLVAGPVFVQQWLPRFLLGMIEGNPLGRWNSYAKREACRPCTT